MIIFVKNTANKVMGYYEGEGLSAEVMAVAAIRDFDNVASLEETTLPVEITEEEDNMATAQWRAQLIDILHESGFLAQPVDQLIGINNGRQIVAAMNNWSEVDAWLQNAWED